MMKTAALFFALTSVLASSEELYTRTPVGWVLSHCVHEVPEGAHHIEQQDGSTHVFESHEHQESGRKPSLVIPRCDRRDKRAGHEGEILPVLRRNAVANVTGTPLPPDYDGWLQYTAVNVSTAGISGGFDAFTNIMSVPDLPKRRPQILYLFPGLQNIDWIPKVDPEPTDDNPFDIIQPVLQYPGGFFSGGWELKSWYVTVNAGALYSSGITGIKEGDAILCNMTRTGPTSWVVVGALQSDPKKVTTQHATNDRLKLQPWAYNTLECYGCSGCGTYPTKPITFTDNKLFQGGKLVSVSGSEWQINPKPAKKLECNEATKVVDNGDTTISFQ